jgi:hypothetical protein
LVVVFFAVAMGSLILKIKECPAAAERAHSSGVAQRAMKHTHAVQREKAARWA